MELFRLKGLASFVIVLVGLIQSSGSFDTQPELLEQDSVFGEEDQTTTTQEPPPCSKTHPLLTQGHFGGGSAVLFKSYLKMHGSLLIGMSSSNCNTCCFQEYDIPFIDKLREQSFGKDEVVNGRKIYKSFAIGRIDCRKDYGWYELCETHGVLPSYLFYNSTSTPINKPFILKYADKPELVYLQAKRIKEPWTVIKSLKEFYFFVKKPAYRDSTGRYLSRKTVVAILDPSNERLSGLLKDFIDVANQGFTRIEVRFGLIENITLAAQIKDRLPEYFPEESLENLFPGSSNPNPGNNSMFLSSTDSKLGGDSEIAFYHPKRVPSFKNWVSESLVLKIEEYSWLVSLNPEMPLMVFFLDLSSQEGVETSKHFMALVKESKIADRFFYRVNFMWAEVEDNKKLLLSMGQEGCILPCAGFQTGKHMPDKLFIPPSLSTTSERGDKEALREMVSKLETFIERYYQKGLENRLGEVRERESKVNEFGERHFKYVQKGAYGTVKGVIRRGQGRYIGGVEEQRTKLEEEMFVMVFLNVSKVYDIVRENLSLDSSLVFEPLLEISYLCQYMTSVLSLSNVHCLYYDENTNRRIEDRTTDLYWPRELSPEDIQYCVMKPSPASPSSPRVSCFSSPFDLSTHLLGSVLTPYFLQILSSLPSKDSNDQPSLEKALHQGKIERIEDSEGWEGFLEKIRERYAEILGKTEL